jgi:arylsulfatase A-like enzyme
MLSSRPFIIYSIFFLLLGTACSCSHQSISSLERPNIILVMIDNVGFDEIGINGNELVSTPHLDRFASQGIQFSRFYSNPLCAPTRASLMTGRYHYRTGVIHTSRGGAKMHGDEITLAELLKEAGYATGIFGKWHLGDNYPMRPQDQGFDETLFHKSGRLGQVPDHTTYINPGLWENGKWVQKEGYCTDILFDAAMKFMEKHLHQPFFIYLPTNIAHASSEVGLEVPRKYSDKHVSKGLEPGKATVCGMLENFDENFGRLMARLETLELRDNTLIIFLSDDGNVSVNTGHYRGNGYSSPYEGSIRVPCFVQWPGHFPGGNTILHIASHIDIFPTICEITGLHPETDVTVDGLSLLPLLQGRTGQWPDRMLFLQCSRGMTPQRYQNCAVITEGFKLVCYPGTFEDRQLETSRDNPVLELYNIPDDPIEAKNLAGQYPGVTAELLAAYDSWFDDVKNSRNFSPGLIHIGTDAENPTYLSRYQDASYIDRKPAGWPVYIESPGKYELTVNRGESLGPGKLCIRYDSTLATRPLSQGENQAIFSLPQGKVNLDVWVEEDGRDYVPRPDEDRIGDVQVRPLTKDE